MKTSSRSQKKLPATNIAVLLLYRSCFNVHMNSLEVIARRYSADVHCHGVHSSVMAFVFPVLTSEIDSQLLKLTMALYGCVLAPSGGGVDAR